MSDLHFTEVLTFQENQYKHGVYILLINADKTPPHLAVLDNGIYYSLGVNGLRIVPYNSFKSYLDKKKSKVIFIELGLTTIDFNLEFSKYGELNKEANTCIFPLKHAINQILKFDVTSIRTIFDLIKVLESDNAINQIFGKNISSSEFIVKHYNLKDVYNRINELTKDA